MNLFDVYPLLGIDIRSGTSAYVYDANGKEYLDFYGGHAVISIGHSHPHYQKRIGEQLSKLGFYSNFIINRLQEELAEKLGKASDYAAYNLFLINSGAEAIENALKLASWRNGKAKVLAFGKCFHGRTAAAINITDEPIQTAPINSGFQREFLPLNDVEALENALSQNDACAVIIEGIQGIGGIHLPDDTFMQECSRLSRRYGVTLILDEIQSGYGRSGRFFAHQYAGIRPDLITIAKGMGNGFPVAGVLISPEFEAKHGLLGTTFGGAHLACAAALAVLEVMETEDLITNAASMGEYLMRELKSVDGLKEVRGRGLMIGLEFDFPVATLRKRLIEEKRVFTGSASDKHVMRLLPPLCIGKAEADKFLESLNSIQK